MNNAEKVDGVPQVQMNGQWVELGKSLMHAAQTGDAQTVEQLLCFGAPVATDWLGMTPLHHAALKGHTKVVEVLLRAGSGFGKEPRSKVDKTPLHLACQEGHIGIVKQLINNGSDIEAIDMIHMTPLHWAVQMDHTNLVNLLLLNGANPSALNKFEKNCFEIAEENRNGKILKLLMDYKNKQIPTKRLPIPLPLDGANKKIYVKSVPKRLKLVENVQQNYAENAVWQYLEDHGIEMLEGEDVSTVAAAIGSGQSVYVTEAGKQALHLTENQKAEMANDVAASKHETSPKDTDSWHKVLKLNRQYAKTKKELKLSRERYLYHKQEAIQLKQQIADALKAIPNIDKLDAVMQFENDDDEVDEDDLDCELATDEDEEEEEEEDDDDEIAFEIT